MLRLAAVAVPRPCVLIGDAPHLDQHSNQQICSVAALHVYGTLLTPNSMTTRLQYQRLPMLVCACRMQTSSLHILLAVAVAGTLSIQAQPVAPEGQALAP